MRQLLLTASDLAELGHFMHSNFRGTEKELLTRWLNAKLEAQTATMPRPMAAAEVAPSPAAMAAVRSAALKSVEKDGGQPAAPDATAIKRRRRA